MKNSFIKGYVIGVVLAILSFGGIYFLATNSNFKKNNIPDTQIFSDLINAKNEIITIQKSDYYLVNYWATWCKPCVAEMPLLDSLSIKLKKHDIHVVGVSNEKDEQKALRFIASQTFKNLELFYQKKQTENINALPTTILMNSNYKILWSKTGMLNDDLNKLTKTILEKIE